MLGARTASSAEEALRASQSPIKSAVLDRFSMRLISPTYASGLSAPIGHRVILVLLQRD